MPTKVVIYTTRSCSYCHAAKQFLKEQKVTFEEIDVTHDAAMRNKLVSMSGQQTVPQIFAGDKSLGGYDDLVRYYNAGHRL